MFGLVQLYRQSLSRGLVHFKAQLQLAHLFCECKGQRERDTNLAAADLLMRRMIDFRRKFCDILQKLKYNFGLSSVTVSRQTRDRAFSFLVENNIVKVRSTEIATVESY